jgi:hypothetical protein
MTECVTSCERRDPVCLEERDCQIAGLIGQSCNQVFRSGLLLVQVSGLEASEIGRPLFGEWIGGQTPWTGSRPTEFLQLLEVDVKQAEHLGGARPMPGKGQQDIDVVRLVQAPTRG